MYKWFIFFYCLVVLVGWLWKMFEYECHSHQRLKTIKTINENSLKRLFTFYFVRNKNFINSYL